MSPADVEVSPFVHARQLTRELAETDDPAQREVLMVGIAKVFESVATRLAMAASDLTQALTAGATQVPHHGGRPDTRKIDILRGYIRDGDWRNALKLASSFPRLGADATVLRTGWESYARPDFQRQLGRDPQKQIHEAIKCLLRRYNPAKGGE